MRKNKVHLGCGWSYINPHLFRPIPWVNLFFCCVIFTEFSETQCRCKLQQYAGEIEEHGATNVSRDDSNFQTIEQQMRTLYQSHQVFSEQTFPRRQYGTEMDADHHIEQIYFVLLFLHNTFSKLAKHINI